MRAGFRIYAWFFAAFLLAAAWFGGTFRQHWIDELLESHILQSKKMASEIGDEVAKGRTPSAFFFRRWTDHEGQLAYIVVANFKTGDRSGVVSAKRLALGAKTVVDYMKGKTDNETLVRLSQHEGGFPGEYLDVVSVNLLPTKTISERTPLGSVKVAWILPGFPFGRGFSRLWMVFWVVGALFAVVLLAEIIVRRREHAIVVQGVGRGGGVDLDSLDDLEEDLDEPQSSHLVDEAGREWTLLYDGESFDNWMKAGDWYISEDELAVQPWGGSLVYANSDLTGNYLFQLRARRMAGDGGIITLFSCDGYALTWVAGGWGNRFSEVVGYPETRRSLSMERFTWYKLEVRVGENQLEGWVEDAVVWRIDRKSISKSSPELGFQKGLGIATWSTFAKFKDLRFLKS